MIVRSILWLCVLVFLVQLLFVALGTGSGSSGVGDIRPH
jgi:hypothetical protein